MAEITTEKEKQQDRASRISDGAYISRSEAPNMPRVLPNTPEPEKREVWTMPVGVAAILCLAFLFLGLWLGGRDALTLRREVPATPVPTEESVTEAAPTAAPVLTAGEIYTLACRQTVGVAAEAEESNVFGSQAAVPVSATGCVLTEDGYILTSYGALEKAILENRNLTVKTWDDRVYPAELVGCQSQSDIAILKIDEGSFVPVVSGDLDSMEIGDTVYAVGNPLGELTFTLVPCSLAAERRQIAGSESLMGENCLLDVFQISAAVAGASAGGPVYNSYGQVVGMITGRCSAAGAGGLGVAVPLEDALVTGRDLMKNGYVRGKPLLGVTVQTVTAAVAEYYNLYYADSMVEGAQIYSLAEDGAAARAGLQAGDILVGVDGEAITSGADLTAAERFYRAGDEAVFTVYRAGELLSVPVVFDERQPELDAGDRSALGAVKVW